MDQKWFKRKSEFWEGDLCLLLDRPWADVLLSAVSVVVALAKDHFVFLELCVTVALGLKS